MYCSNCGEESPRNHKVCSSCGSTLKFIAGGRANNHNSGFVSPSVPAKSPTTATLLSCLINGLGQMYLGQVGKGVLWILGGSFLIIFTGGILALPIWIATMIDANLIAKKLERKETVGKWEFF